MPITLEGLVAKLAKRPLPAMAVTIQRVKYLQEDPITSNQDLQKVIGLDPGFTMDIYRTYGASQGNKRGPATDVAHAISMLGPLPVKIAAKNLPSLDKTLPDAAKVGIYQVYSRAVHAAMYAKAIGELRGDKNIDEMGLAALMHNCGEMALWAYASKPMLEIYKLVKKGSDYGSASYSILGFTLKQLNTALAKKWHLSPLITETTDHTWFGKSRSMAVQIACSIARESASGWNSSEVEDLIELLGEYIQHNKEKTTAFIHSIAAQTDRQLFGLPLPASTYNMLRQPPVTIITEKKKPQKPTIEIVPKKQPKKKKPIVFEQVPEKPKRSKRPDDVTSLTELLKQMPREQKTESKPIQVARPVNEPPVKKKKPKTVAKPVNEAHAKKEEPAKATKTEEKPITKQPKEKPVPPRVVQKAKAPMEWESSLSKYMRKMRNDLGLKRVMFALISDNNQQAKVSEIMGADVDSGLNRFVVNIQEENLFKLLLSKQQGFWLKASNREKFLPMIPEELLDSIDQNGFFCMSLFARGKPVGLIYADGTYVLNEDSYADFKQLCAELCLALGQVNR
jgi:HD-like signal output (HDOD) protein